MTLSTHAKKGTPHLKWSACPFILFFKKKNKGNFFKKKIERNSLVDIKGANPMG